jgi:squalene-associated FAD-dependent desaturase
MKRRVAVVGGGWAGLAAAVEATDRGSEIALFEMAGQLGGRARGVVSDGPALDNGQHILIGAYTETLRVMRRVGVPPEDVLLRSPLSIVDPHGRGLVLPEGRAVPAFLRAVWARRDWSMGDRLSLLLACGTWALRGFRCEPDTDVAAFTAGLPEDVRRELIEPLTVAALNTPPEEASTAVLLRVLKDALFGSAGGSDLLLPRQPLSSLLPEPAQAWLLDHGAQIERGRRVASIASRGDGWLVDGEPFDSVILACSAAEAARLVEPVDPAWSTAARALSYQPIATVYVDSPGSRLPSPMLALRSDAARPAQFVFDLGALRGPELAGCFAFVVSGAARWLERGVTTLEIAILEQAWDALPAGWARPPQVRRTLFERRATFACRPGLRRPGQTIARGLMAAGDYVHGPYPATLEGAVRSGVHAARAIP